jgi:hypothetical protein
MPLQGPDIGIPLFQQTVTFTPEIFLKKNKKGQPGAPQGRPNKPSRLEGQLSPG